MAVSKPPHSIKAAESERIIKLLQTRPLPEVKRLTGRSYGTLCKIAEVTL